MVQMTVVCCHCDSDQLVKNGHAKNGKQRYKCRSCGKQSRENPSLPGLTAQRAGEILRAYEERQSMRGVARTFRISRNTLTKLLKGGRQASSPGGDPRSSRPAESADAGIGAG